MTERAALALLTAFAGIPDTWAADASAFEAHCAKCHERASALARRLEGGTKEERMATLGKLLETHHVEDPQARAAIVEYLAGLAEAQSQRRF